MADENSGRSEEFLGELQSQAWEDYTITGKSTAMAAYLAADGAVDLEVRQILIDLLLNGSKDDRTGGRDDGRDVNTYKEVLLLKMAEGCSKTEACRRFANRYNQELRTVEVRYARGRELLKTNDA